MGNRIVVEWTRSALRVAVTEGSGRRLRLRAIHSQPLGASSEVGAALRALLRTTKTATAAAEVVGVVPREQAISRLVTFPSTEPAELSQMVELYAKAQLPYPREQTVTDFHVLNQQGGVSTVAVIACQREVIERAVAVLREAGLSPNLLTLSSWGVLEWYRQIRRAGAGPEAAAEPALVIHVDETRTDLVLVSEGRIVSSRGIGQGSADWGAAGEVTDLLTAEVERSQAAIQKELPSLAVRSIVLTGSGDVAAWREPLAQRLGLPVAAVEGTASLGRWPGSAAVAGSPVVVGGLACGELRERLNLSPPEVRAHVRHREQVRELVAAGALLLGVLALGSGLLGLQTVRERRQARRLEQALAAVEPDARRLQDKTRSAQLVGALLESRRRLADHLVGVLSSTPPEVTLEALTFERARQELVVRGHAASTQTVLEYLKQLEQLEGIGAVQLKHSTRRSSASGERTEFELILRQQGAS
ncbi:MAG: pilus assembly protein PilM [Candidatus Omnitrophica bacterium]|nr:pilus assembly protein PilM [Candidatus Omnitrophota bacterium]